jgi:hypothetical protein
VCNLSVSISINLPLSEGRIEGGGIHDISTPHVNLYFANQLAPNILTIVLRGKDARNTRQTKRKKSHLGRFRPALDGR